jgi:hypothetical protein
MFRSSGVQKFRGSEVQGFRGSGVGLMGEKLLARSSMLEGFGI